MIPSTLQPTSVQSGEVVSIPYQLDAIYRTESRRILATLIRLLGDFDLAEDALHDAFRAATEQWNRDGIPANPRSWLVSAGRFKAIDTVRRRSRFDKVLNDLAEQIDSGSADPATLDDETIEDDRLRLIFTCCHPLLPQDARVALTLREVCGLTTEAIAHAFLTAPATLAQRIVRAKNRIRDAHIPYEVPARAELPERLDTVLQVIYLVFNEGYYTSSGETLTRPDLSEEAIRIGHLLYQLLPEAEVMGLLSMMLLHEARRTARSTAEGEMISLEEQDRSLWQRAKIDEATALVQQAFRKGPVGVYALQAAIAAVHSAAVNFASTNWVEIVGLYDLLYRVTPSAIVELNRAVAIAMRDGAQSGLVLIDHILGRGELTDYHLLHTARADLLRRLDQKEAARAAYTHAIELTQQEPERRFIKRRMDAL